MVNWLLTNISTKQNYSRNILISINKNCKFSKKKNLTLNKLAIHIKKKFAKLNLLTNKSSVGEKILDWFT